MDEVLGEVLELGVVVGAVVGAFEFQEFRFAGEASCQADGVEGGFGAGGGEADALGAAEMGGDAAG